MAQRSARLDAWVRRWWGGDGGAWGGVADVALAPTELLYRGAIRARNLGYDRGWLTAEVGPIPVISIGNIGVGGAGKTPFAAWLVQRLAGWGERPAVVIRGYGEDEVLLHGELNPGIPLFATPRRIAGVRDAAAAGATVAVLDDAFQHRRIVRDLDVVLVSAEAWSARRRLLPRGPWRESERGLLRADVIVVTRKAAAPQRARAVAAELAAWSRGRSVVVCGIAPSALSRVGASSERMTLDRLAGRDVLAVAALADPLPFLDNLRALGTAPEPAVYADHYAFSASDAALLVRRAAGRPLVMTHKDAVKLAPLIPPGASAYVLHQELRVEEGDDALVAALHGVLGRTGRA